MINRRSASIILALALTCLADTSLAQQPLLISEISAKPFDALDPSSDDGEYIEIYNPNASAIDLTDIYLSDATFAPNSVFYYNLVTGNRLATGGGGFDDFTARFPDGATIDPGEYQVIAIDGSDVFFAEFGQNPDYELYEDAASPDGIPDMREAISGSINNQGGLTDSGEAVILFFWDGISDLVQDLDYAVWGDKAEAVDKTGVTIDGPDGDSSGSTYLDDTSTSSQAVVSLGPHPVDSSYQRTDLSEGNEIQSGGNGVTGSDETSEDLQNTWCIGTSVTPGAASDCPSPLPPLICSDSAVPIHAVQGAGDTSPLEGDSVIVEAVVVADFSNGQPTELNGFFLQEEDSDADADPSTSEGLFVLTDLLDVSLGDHVRVRGLVDESSGLTRLISVDEAIVCDTGLSVTPAEFELPFADPSELEAVEGMAVNLPQALTISETRNLVRFGEFTISTGRLLQPTQVAMPGTPANDFGALNDRKRILVNDGRNGTNAQPFTQGQDNANPLSASNPVRVGSRITNLQGVMNFTFNNFKIEPRLPYEIVAVEPRTSVPDLASAPLRVGAINLLNYFSTLDNSGTTCGPASNQACRGADTASELSRQTHKIVSAISGMGANIVALSEIENNESASLQILVDALNSASSPGTWDFVDAGSIGTDAIKVGLLYTPASIGLIGTPAILDSSVDPGFDSSLNRPALAQTFEHMPSGERLTVSANHLKSKSCNGASGLDTDQGDGQQCFNATRTNAAQALLDWLENDPTGSNDPDYLILGDLNSYPMEDPIQALLLEGLVDLAAAFQSLEQAYSFNSFGESGALDYAISSPALALKVLDATHWSINADELAQIDYNEEALSTGTPKPVNFYNPDAFRSSDHDPVVVAISAPQIFSDRFESP